MELILITFVLSFIGFAVYGFISFILWLVRPRKSRAVDDKVSDAIAACRAIDRLKLSGVIGWAEYGRLRRALRDSFPAAALPAELDYRRCTADFLG